MPGWSAATVIRTALEAAATDRKHVLNLEEAGAARVREALRARGLWLDLGAARIQVRSASQALAAQLSTVYAHYPFDDAGTWADAHVVLEPPRGVRRWLRPQVTLRCDGRHPFEPFPADSPLPLFEWGCNWLISHRRNDLLLLHSAVVERDGLALVLPAMPGSGKSTLAAALSLRGWRLLSDEFGALEPNAETFHALLKPVALKNESIEVIRRFSPEAVLGPAFPKTRKGTVAHLAPSSKAVAARRTPVLPGAVVLPRWRAGSATTFEPLPADRLFHALTFNAFNYRLLGEVGFRAVTRLVRRCPGWQLTYSDLDDALTTLDRAWSGVLARQREEPSA